MVSKYKFGDTNVALKYSVDCNNKDVEEVSEVERVPNQPNRAPNRLEPVPDVPTKKYIAQLYKNGCKSSCETSNKTYSILTIETEIFYSNLLGVIKILHFNTGIEEKIGGIENTQLHILHSFLKSILASYKNHEEGKVYYGV